jgi:hypothetical protein
MSASAGPTFGMLKELAGLVVAVAGESVTMLKRTTPEHALKLKKQREWEIYMEFLKLFFDLTARLSVLYIPVAEQPHFMESLEDTVTQHMKTMLEPALGPDADDMEIFLTIGRVVSESRQQYERFRFMVTEDSTVKEDYFRFFSQRIASLLDATDNGMVTSAATLCATAVIPAINAVLSGGQTVASGDGPPTPEPVSERAHLSPLPSQSGSLRTEGPSRGNEIKLVSVLATAQGEEVETRWGLHPRFRQDLKPEEAQQLTRYMNRITQILGHRYATVAFSPDWAPWNRIGHA